jgi:hypothetical protein
MKVNGIDLRNMRNQEWFNFYTEFKRSVEEASPEKLNITQAFIVFLTLYVKVDIALVKHLKSSFTAAMVALDGQRDQNYRGLTTALKAAFLHFDPVKREAAELLWPLWELYGNIQAKPYNEETGTIINFIQELRGKYAEAIAILGLTEWVDALEKSNNDFEDAVLNRNRETAEKPDLHLLDLRRQTNNCYLGIIARIEAQMLLQGEDEFASFVKTLNANIDRYVISQHRRSGKNAANKAADAATDTAADTEITTPQ